MREWAVGWLRELMTSVGRWLAGWEDADTC